MDIQDMSNRQLEDLRQAVSVELQDREYRIQEQQELQIMKGYTNEEVFEDALSMGLTPDDPDIIDEGYAWEFAEYIAQKERKQSMKTTGA